MCCFQSVKVKKFESNSQLCNDYAIMLYCCFQSVKVKKFESNSQQTTSHTMYVHSCFQSVKVKKFESNSQQLVPTASADICCFQSVKVKKFESNSQHGYTPGAEGRSCFQSGKVKKFESNSQHTGITHSGGLGCFQSGKDKRNTFIRYFSRVFFPESVFGYVTACPFRSDHLENPLPSEDADEVNRFYVVVPAPARSRIINLRLLHVFIVIQSGERSPKPRGLQGVTRRFIRYKFRIPVGMPTYKGCFPDFF